MGELRAPFPYFGGKSKACELVWQRFGEVKNYVEPFCGSAAMLLGAPDGSRIETINDADGFIANFWRAVTADPAAVAHYADYPVSEIDFHARQAWLVNRAERLRYLLEDVDYYDPKIAGWWCWGANLQIGAGFCDGKGPHVGNGVEIVDTRKLPHLGDKGKGINRELPHLSNKGQGIRHVFILDWFETLSDRLRHVRICHGDWSRVVKDSVTVRHGLTAVFLDPPYTKGSMDYAAGGVGTDLPMRVQAWCAENGGNPKLRIAICGHAGEHDALIEHGWTVGRWKARKGYARTEEARQNTADETIWFSPHCIGGDVNLFSGVANG